MQQCITQLAVWCLWVLLQRHRSGLWSDFSGMCGYIRNVCMYVVVCAYLCIICTYICICTCICICDICTCVCMCVRVHNVTVKYCITCNELCMPSRKLKQKIKVKSGSSLLQYSVLYLYKSWSFQLWVLLLVCTCLICFM